MNTPLVSNLDRTPAKSPPKIVIIDTGCSNTNSVRFAIERLGYAVKISRDPNIVLAADKLFLPGVGTASEAMKNLESRGLIALIQQIEQPILGICLGMQLLGTISHEGKQQVTCLGHIQTQTHLLDTGGLPRPHMGWNTVQVAENHPLFHKIPTNSYFYFVHSFAMPIGSHTIGTSHYGQMFSAAVQVGNFFGVQFHPERSSKVGAQLIQNFLEI